VRFPLQDTDINCTSNSVHICTAGCQPLLRALRFAQQNNTVFQQADCIHTLVFILWPKAHSTCHSLLSCSKHCLCDVHFEGQNSLPKKAHEHYNDLLKHCIHNFTCPYCDFGLLHGRLALDTLSRFTCPQIIPQKLACGEPCTFVQTVHTPPLLQLL
jgi:hypothetical protein